VKEDDGNMVIMAMKYNVLYCDDNEGEGGTDYDMVEVNEFGDEADADDDYSEETNGEVQELGH
jgi:hypothetical protein